MKRVLREIEDIRLDQVHGASELALKALQVLGSAALGSKARTAREFVEEINSYAHLLRSARPAMVAITNCVRCFEHFMKKTLAHCCDIEEARSGVLTAVERVTDAVVSARYRSIAHAAELIGDGAAVMTCSFSSTVIETFKRAKEQGKVFKVFCLESSCGNYKYGELVAARLEQSGTAVEVMPDREIDDMLTGIDMVLIGSDVILLDGSVVNGYPSLSVARAAARAPFPVPVYCIGDWTKLHPSSQPPVYDPGLDLIPSDFIRGIVTENGIVAPSGLSIYLHDLSC